MVSTVRYQPVLKLISDSRVNSYKIFFNDWDSTSELSKYGAYIWSQKVSSSLYPLMQHLEILLRNSIDQAAKRRFGDYWWDQIELDSSKDNYNDFCNGISLAKRKLTTKWKKQRRDALGLGKRDPVPEPEPSFSHDDILAATDFGVWLNVFNAGLSSPNNADNDKYLWPKSFSKSFRRFNILAPSPDDARLEFLRLINEIKDYRNRLFHHDCIWVKSSSSHKQDAIETIRHKINLIGKLIEAISPVTYSTLNAWGTFYHARRICSVEEFDLYTQNSFDPFPEDGHFDFFDSLVSTQKSMVLSYADTPIYMHKFR